MKNIKIILLTLISVFTFHSCDILDLKPLDKLSEADVWNDPVLIQLYVNSSYHGVTHGLSDSNLSLYTDDSFAMRNDVQTVLAGSMDQENVSTLTVEVNYWGHAYSVIRKINNFFERIDNTPTTEEQRRLMMGEMKFLRGFIYAELIERYDGVPIITKTYQLHDDFQLSRDSYGACVDFIKSELEEAISMLPDKQPDSEKGRASADAARALLSRVLLYAASPLNNQTNDKSKWQTAADAAKVLIDTRYELHPNYQSLFLSDNKEIIFARWYNQDNGELINTRWGRGGSDGYGSMNPTQNLINSYEMIATGKRPYIEKDDGTIELDINSGYDISNPYQGRDPRFEASIIHDGTIWANRETETWSGGKDSREGEGDYHGSYTSYYIKKFMPEDIPPTGSTQKPETPWIHFRYAEILLNYAEAKFELGDEPTAREYLNKVRSRQSVNMPDVTDSGDALKEKIRNERRIEMAFESRRFFDVRRWKIAAITEKKSILSMKIIKNGTQKTYTQEVLFKRDFPERQYLVPIPRSEIEKSFESLKQNQGY